MKRCERWARGILAGLVLVVLADPALAGCGCDHPPPAFAPVMPPFGAPGTRLVLHVGVQKLRPERRYAVEFLTLGTLLPTRARGRAVTRGSLVVEAPGTLAAGPTRIRVRDGAGRLIAEFDDSLFTGLPLPRRMPDGNARVVIEDFHAPVSRDGVLYLAVDLHEVRDGTQFAFALPDTPITFGPDDVVFYNRDGVDLTLFTLAVEDPTERQWGSYHGWDVDQDGGIIGTVFEPKVGAPPDPSSQSDVLSYWRHEFHTYAAAHAPGGTHEVGPHGRHPDGTLHVDHDRLVVAIRGRTGSQSLAPGRVSTDLLVVMVGSEGPIEPEAMAEAAYDSTIYVEENAALAGWLGGATGQDSVTVEEDEPGLTDLVDPVGDVVDDTLDGTVGALSNGLGGLGLR